MLRHEYEQTLADMLLCGRYMDGWSCSSAVVVDSSLRHARVGGVVARFIAAVTKVLDRAADGAECGSLVGFVVPARLNHRVKPMRHRSATSYTQSDPLLRLAADMFYSLLYNF